MTAKNFWGYVLAVFIGGLAAIVLSLLIVKNQIQSSTSTSTAGGILSLFGL